MSVFIGRLFNIGLGKEGTRGTAVAATAWFAKTDFSVEDKIKSVVSEGSMGIIEDANTQEITQKYADGMIAGRITDLGLGLLLSAALGTDTVGAVETGVKDHVFTLLESAQHPSMTLVVSEPNAQTTASLSYPLAMLSSLQIDFAVGAWASYKAQFTMNTPSTASATPAFTDENAFNPQYCIMKIASSYSGLSAASAISVRSASITLTKNIEDDTTIGNLSAVDRYNKQFTIEGNAVLVYKDRSYIDTIMLGDLVKSIRLQAINTGVTIGAASNPTITIDLARVKITEVARTDKNADVMLQTIKFKAFYSITDSLMTKITLRNTQTSAY